MAYSTLYTVLLEQEDFYSFTNEYQLEHLIKKLERDIYSLVDFEGEDSDIGRAGRAHWRTIIECRKSHIHAIGCRNKKLI